MSNRLRAIDALIAEHCMEWRWYTHHDAPGRFLAFYQDRKPWWDVASGEEHVCQARGPSIPRYSTDPAAAKQLRDKMRGLGWTVTVEGWKSFDHDEFRVSLRIYEDQAWQCQKDIRGEDEFLCVALAILAALQIAVPE